jgi:antitoxin ParD1/3/4
MQTVAIDLPAEELEWLNAQVAGGRAESVDALIVELLQQAKDEEAELELLKEAIDKGRASGLSTRTLQQIYDDFMMRRNAA